jgi:hypothetical protein
VDGIDDGAADTMGSARLINGRYRLGARLGRGRLGEIFEAHDLADRDLGVEHRKALQLLAPNVVSDPGFAERLARAYDALRTGVHPNLVRIFDIGRDGQHHYLVMELLAGASLRTVLDDAEVLPLEETLPVIGAVGSALAYLHVKGVVHDNIQPDQVFVTHDYEVKLLDVVPLSLRETPAKVSDDVFGLACLAYTLLAGRHPYNACSAREAQRAGLKLAPITGLPAETWAALEHGLALSAETRPASVTELMLELGLRGAERLPAGSESQTRPEAHTARESHTWPARARTDPALHPFDWTDYGAENRARQRTTSRFGQVSVILLAGAAVLAGAIFLTNESLRTTTTDLFARGAPPIEDAGNQSLVPPSAEPELAISPATGEPPVATSSVESSGELGVKAPPVVASEPEPPTTSNAESVPAVVELESEPVAGAEIAVVPPEAPATASQPPTDAADVSDEEPRLGFAASVIAAAETDPAARVVLERSGNTNIPETVVWWTTDGTAIADEDYADLGERTETLGPGEVERTLLVPLIQDTVPESAEQFHVHVGRYDQSRRHLALVSSVRVEIRAD